MKIYNSNYSEELKTMSATVEDPPSSSSSSSKSPMSHSEIFNIVGEGKRKQIVASVQSPDISLGMVDPVTGRSLLYKLLTQVLQSINQYLLNT